MKKSKINGYVILVTATINPGLYAESVRRNDPKIRIKDYLNSLTFWENLGDPRIKSIIFCDNSGSNLDGIKKACRNFKLPIEFLVFDGNTKPEGVHYGYSELGIIDYVIGSSEKIHMFSHFIKVTGRLTYPNLSKILDTLPENFDAVVDHRKRYKNENGYFLRARTQLMIFKLSFYKENLFQKRYEMLGNFSHIEEFIAIKLESSMAISKVIQRFKSELFIAGLSGHKNENYASYKNKLKFNLRRVVRFVSPNIWL